MWLSIIGLIVAGASALFGIWSAKDVEYTKAWIASGLTAAGIAVSLFAAWHERSSSQSKARLEEQRHEQLVADLKQQRQDAINRERTTFAQFRALQTSMALNNLEIIWEIPKAPDSLKDAIYLAKSMFDSHVTRDDEYTRMLSQSDLSDVAASLAIDNAISPILAALAEGSTDVRKFYSGDIEDAVELYRDLPERYDPLGGPYVDRSEDIDPVLLLPLNVAMSGILAVGRKADDPRQQQYVEDPDSYEAISNDLLKARSFGFSATVTDRDDALELRFSYDRKSLEQAARLAPGQMMTIAWPDAFNFIIVAKGLAPGDDYLSLLKDKIKPDDNFGNPSSTLTLIPNGLMEAAIQFDVAAGATEMLRTDLSTYYDDYNTDLFQYTAFHARKREMQAASTATPDP
jgi:hypothetical protein